MKTASFWRSIRSALDTADVLAPLSSAEIDELPTPVRVQCRLFDALVLLNAARADLTVDDTSAFGSLASELEEICHEVDSLLEKMAW